MKRITILLIVFITTIAFMEMVESCTNKKDAMPTSGGGTSASICTSTFSATVSSIIKTNCAINSGCHGVGASRPLTNYAQIAANATKIKAAVESKSMPIGNPLSQSNIDKISCWVTAGATNN